MGQLFALNVEINGKASSVVYVNAMQTSNVPQTGFAPVHNLRSDFTE